jgi:hypothetical protein
LPLRYRRRLRIGRSKKVLGKEGRCGQDGGSRHAGCCEEGRRQESTGKEDRSTAEKEGSEGSRSGRGPAGASARPVSEDSTDSPAVMQRIIECLHKMNKRPTKLASLRRALKPLLGSMASDQAINIALNRLIPMGIVVAGSNGEVNYPKFA